MHKLLVHLPTAILLAGSALVWSAHQQDAMPLVASMDSIVPELAGFDVVNQAIGDEERRVAGMTDYVARSYQQNGTVAFTTLVSYYDRQTRGKTIHSPRNCLPGAGWEIVNGRTHAIAVGDRKAHVNRFILRNGKAAAVAYYWYQGRGRVTANEYAVKWNLLRDAALLGRTEEALVRIVVPIDRALVTADGLPNLAADTTAQRLAARLMADVDRVLPRTESD